MVIIGSGDIAPLLFREGQMEFSLTPNYLLQNLLDETRILLISLINQEFNKFPTEIQQEWKSKLGLSPITTQQTEYEVDLTCDLYEVLRLLWKDWESLKPIFFEISRRTNYGAIYRSYLFIIRFARDEWAHFNTYTYEDVLHYGFVVQRFITGFKLPFESSIIDQIIEVCLEKVSKLGEQEIPSVRPMSISSNNMEILTNELGDVGDKKGVIQEVLQEKKEEDISEELPGEVQESSVQINWEELRTQFTNAVSKIKERYDNYELSREHNIPTKNWIIPNRLQINKLIDGYIKANIEEKDNENFSAIDSEMEEELMNTSLKQITIKEFVTDHLRRIVEEEKYDRLEKLTSLRKKTNVQPGKFPETLLISDGEINISYGIDKYGLIEKYILDIASFSILGFVKPEMNGKREGKQIICIPTIDNTILGLGRNKARLICGSMDRISKWLEIQRPQQG
jgi:hypothetical protein